jgi:PEP-CTERM motif-containing protein
MEVAAMRHRAAGFLVFLLFALPASATVEYAFSGSVTEDLSGFFPAGTSISGRLFWSPENADPVLSDFYYSYIFSYEYNIGGVSYSSPAALDMFASLDSTSTNLYDLTPNSSGPVFFDEILFSSTFAMASFDSDLSGLWRADGNVIMPGPNVNIAEFHGFVTMTLVPEPDTLALFASTILMAALFRRRRSRLRQ